VDVTVVVSVDTYVTVDVAVDVTVFVQIEMISFSNDTVVVIVDVIEAVRVEMWVPDDKTFWSSAAGRTLGPFPFERLRDAFGMPRQRKDGMRTDSNKNTKN
jgi:hypothetical protein